MFDNPLIKRAILFVSIFTIVIIGAIGCFFCGISIVETIAFISNGFCSLPPPTMLAMTEVHNSILHIQEYLNRFIFPFEIIKIFYIIFYDFNYSLFDLMTNINYYIMITHCLKYTQFHIYKVCVKFIIK